MILGQAPAAISGGHHERPMWDHVASGKAHRAMLPGMWKIGCVIVVLGVGVYAQSVPEPRQDAQTNVQPNKAICSVPLLAVKIPTDKNFTIREMAPTPGSKSLIVKPPAPPCPDKAQPSR
jgi:hypothetical protein